MNLMRHIRSWNRVHVGRLILLVRAHDQLGDDSVWTMGSSQYGLLYLDEISKQLEHQPIVHFYHVTTKSRPLLRPAARVPFCQGAFQNRG